MNPNENPHKPPTRPLSKSPKVLRNRRELLFSTLKSKHPNIHAVYLMTSVVCIWSGCWYLADTWAQGGDLMAAALQINPWVPIRHFFLVFTGCLLLYADDKSLAELVLMKKTVPPENPRSMSRTERLFYNFKTRYPNLATIYTIFGIILSWCGTWGLLWDIPIQPFWRSLLTIFLGFFLLYIDDLKLDEI